MTHEADILEILSRILTFQAAMQEQLNSVSRVLLKMAGEGAAQPAPVRAVTFQEALGLKRDLAELERLFGLDEPAA